VLLRHQHFAVLDTVQLLASVRPVLFIRLLLCWDDSCIEVQTFLSFT